LWIDFSRGSGGGFLDYEEDEGHREGLLTARMYFLKLATNGREIENVSVAAKAPLGEAAVPDILIIKIDKNITLPSETLSSMGTIISVWFLNVSLDDSSRTSGWNMSR
jgi:hypothetical protein